MTFVRNLSKLALDQEEQPQLRNAASCSLVTLGWPGLECFHLKKESSGEMKSSQ